MPTDFRKYPHVLVIISKLPWQLGRGRLWFAEVLSETELYAVGGKLVVRKMIY